MESRAKAGAFFRPLARSLPRSIRDTLRAWVHDPQILKPGSYMPDMQLNGKENDIVVYLQTLK